MLFLAAWATPGLLAQPANWTHYTTADGLASNWVSSIAIDRSGNHWFGTYAGLVSRYDTLNWSSHDIRHKTEPAYGGYAIALDQQGHVWFGTPYGVNRYDGSQWTAYDTSDGLAHNSVRAIVVDQAGTRWFGTLGGITSYDGTAWKTYTVADGLPDNQVFCLAVDSGGAVWAGSVEGISRFTGSVWVKMADHIWVHSLAFDPQNILWAGTRNGLVKYDGQTWVKYTTTKSDSSDQLGSVRAVAPDLVGNLWLGATRTFWQDDGQGGQVPVAWHGALKFDGTNWTYYDSSNGLVNNFVRSITVEVNNHKWFGTDGGAVRCSESSVGIYVPQLPSPWAGPYPFQTLIRIRLPVSFMDPEELTITDLQGMPVKRLSYTRSEGCFIWDGTDGSGRGLPAGAYCYRVTVGNRAVCGKVLKVK